MQQEERASARQAHTLPRRILNSRHCPVWQLLLAPGTVSASRNSWPDELTAQMWRPKQLEQRPEFQGSSRWLLTANRVCNAASQLSASKHLRAPGSTQPEKVVDRLV